MNIKGTVYWITGLSGAGKTTLATALVSNLKSLNQPTLLLDGDVMREIFDAAHNLSRDERFQLSMKYAKLCRTLADQGFNVVCATISLFHETHAWNRQHIANYLEIFLKVPLEELKRRDSKVIYAKMQAGELSNVVGIDIPAEFPKHPDIVIDYNDNLSTDQAVSHIIHQPPRLKAGDTHESSPL